MNDSSEHRNSIAETMSSIAPSRCTSWFVHELVDQSSGRSPSAFSVVIRPGAIALTRM